MQRPTLHNYQKIARDFILKNPYCGLFLKMGLGKAVDDDTEIFLPDGSTKRIGDIVPGDKIIGRSGNPVAVTAVYHHEKKNAYRVTLEDGRSFICCEDHLIPYATGPKKTETDCAPLKEIRKDYRKKHGGTYEYRYEIPLCNPVQFPKRTHGLSPANLGTFLREGWKKDETWTPLQRRQLRELGYGLPDHIPPEYITDSAENRKKLLENLLGKASVNEARFGYRIFRTKYRRLYEQTLLLCHSEGYKILPIKNLKPGHYGAYIYAGQTGNNATAITDITQVENRNMTCFTVDAEDSLYLINDFIVTHNTMITLDALYELNPTRHVLVIAPKTIARCTWEDEIQKWGYPFRTKSLIVNEKGKTLGKKKRNEIYDTIPSSPTTMYFINRELIPDLVKRFPKEKWPFGIVIIDESQSFKSYKAERFKSLKSVRPYVFRMIELTGSPAPNGPEDLWSQIYLLDCGQRLEPTITKYREKYFTPGLIVNNYPATWNIRPGMEDCIYKRIGDIVISMKNQMLKLPPVQYNTVSGRMSENEYKQYKTLLKEFVLDFPDGSYIEAANAAVLQCKLSQIASGAIYKGTGTHEFEIIHEVKLELTEYILNNTEDNVLIAYNFHSDKTMLMEYLAKKEIDARIFDGTPEMKNEWNAGKIKAMLIQPKSAGFGLNLQEGGATLIWYTLPWSLEDYEQTNARIYRQGQTKPVIIHHLIMQKTVDTKILRALEKKDLSQSALIDAVEATVNAND